MATLEGLAARVQELTEGLQRANVAYEQQQKRAAEAEARLLAAEAVIQSQQAAAAAAATTATGATERREKDLIHPSHVPKPHTFNGKKEEWEKFKHVFVAWSSTVHERYPELLEKFGNSKDPVDSAALNSDESRLAKAMYTFLIQYCPEPTMNVIGQGLQDANGFEVWRRLVLLSEPAHRTKAWVWRRHLSNPTFPSDISQWSTALHQWEAELREFERTHKTAFSEDEKVSILAHVAPKELQQSIFMHSDALDNYGKIREYIEQYLINRNLWKRPQGSQFGLTKAANKNVDNQYDDGGVRPMDIGGVKGEKGKGKGDRKEGKGKDNWSSNNKSKDWSNKGKDKKERKARMEKGKERATKEEKENKTKEKARTTTRMQESSATYATGMDTLPQIAGGRLGQSTPRLLPTPVEPVGQMVPRTAPVAATRQWDLCLRVRSALQSGVMRMSSLLWETALFRLLALSS